MSYEIDVNNSFVMLYDFSTVNEFFLTRFLLLKSCSTFYMETQTKQQVLSPRTVAVRTCDFMRIK